MSLADLIAQFEEEPTDECRNALIVALLPYIGAFAKRSHDREEFFGRASLLAVELCTKYQVRLLIGKPRSNARQWLLFSLKHCRLRDKPLPLGPERFTRPIDNILEKDIIAKLRPTEQRIVELLLDGHNMSEVARILKVSRYQITTTRARLYRLLR